MKKIFTVMLCLLMLFSASSCGKRDTEQENASIKDIPTATANKDDTDEESVDNEAAEEDTVPEYSEEETEEYIDSDTSDTDYRSERERVEISNNLRDAEELIENGDYEDAMMIIQSLKTRKLSESENKKLLELQKKMISVSD